MPRLTSKTRFSVEQSTNMMQPLAGSRHRFGCFTNRRNFLAVQTDRTRMKANSQDSSDPVAAMADREIRER